jgi:spoIIIJ-associated protein
VSEGDEVSVEATGETVGEARWAALRDLERLLGEVDRDAVRYTVVSEGERGLLGVGYQPARVVANVSRAAARPAARLAARPAPAGESEAVASVREFLERVLDGLRIDHRLVIRESSDGIEAVVSGSELGRLIGRHGQTIDAIQYLANAARHRALADAPSVVVDAQDYRRRRQRLLTDLALRAADRARRTGEAVELEPMVAAERKIVHLALKDVAGVRTESHGREPNRHVLVLAGDDPAARST